MISGHPGFFQVVGILLGYSSTDMNQNYNIDAETLRELRVVYDLVHESCFGEPHLICLVMILPIATDLHVDYPEYFQ